MFNNGTGEFVKHKFDLLLLILVLAGMVGFICLAEHWHDHDLIMSVVQLFSGLIAVFINLITNRSSSGQRATDTPTPGGVDVTDQNKQ